MAHETADELIRQVTISCSERGLLLLRIRDEIRMTVAAYQTLYESSVAFGMRKALQAEQGKADMEAKVCGCGCQCVVWRDTRVDCAA
jgi:dynein light intermediate chain